MADVRYIVETILKARDDTARAFASATGNLEAYRIAGKEAQRQNEEFARSTERMSSRVEESERKLLNTRKALALSSRDSTDAQVKLEQATRNYVRSLNDVNASEATRRQAMNRMTDANREFMQSLQETDNMQRNVAQRHAFRVQQMASEAEDARRLEQVFTEAARAQDKIAQQRIDREREYQRVLQETVAKEQATRRGTELGRPPDRVRIRVDEDQAAAEAKLALLAAEIRRLDGKEINVSVDLDTERFRRGILAVEQDAGGMFGNLLAGWRNVGASFDESSNRIAAFDNLIRGAFTFLITAFLQPLITLAGAAGGALLALGSSAIFAGGAIGGTLVAGIAQAIPMIGLLATWMYRLKAVFDAAQQAQLVQQQQSYKGAQQHKKTADAASTLANATDGLRNAQEGLAQAHVRVADAEYGVVKARRDALRALEDLMMQEERARLQQERSQQGLRAAISTGGDVASAQIDLEQANLQAGRTAADAARARATPLDRNRDFGILAAQQQLDAAKRGVVDAERAVERARRGIESARRGADIAGQNIMASAGKLDFLLGRMSGAERALYRRVIQLQDAFRKAAERITEPLTRGFADAIPKIIRLLNNRQLSGAMTRLAQSMSQQINRVFDAFTSPAMINTFTGFIDEASRNLKPFTNIIIDIGKIFLNIAKDAMPAFRILLHLIEGWVRQWADWIASHPQKVTEFFKEGVKHLEGWLRLAGSIVKLFLAIAGPGGGAAFGLEIITKLTDKINGLTDDINRGGKAAKTLHDVWQVTREVFRAVGPVLGAIGSQLMDIFLHGGNSVRGFSAFLTTILIPAFGDFIRVLGVVAHAFTIISDIPILGTLSRVVVTLGLLFGFASKASVFFSPFTRGLRVLVGLWAGVSAEELRTATRMDLAKAAWQRFQTTAAAARLASIGDAIIGLGKALRVLASGQGLGAAIEAFKTYIGQAKAARIATAELTVAEEAAAAAAAGQAGAGAGAAGAGAAAAAGGAGSRLLGRLGRGLFKGGVAGAAVGIGVSQLDRLVDHSKIPGGGDTFGQRGALGLDNLNQAFSSLSHLDIGGFFGNLGRDVGKFSTFTKGADDRLRGLIRTQNVKGLRDLAGEATKNAKTWPEYGDALRKLAEQAKGAADRLEAFRKAVRIAGQVGEAIRRRLRGALSIGEIRTGIQTQIDELNKTVGYRSQKGREQMVATYKSSIDQIKLLIRSHVISEKQGMEEIASLRKKMRLAEGADPLGVGRGLARSLASAKKITPQLRDNILHTLQELPPGARKVARDSMFAMLDRMVKSRPDLRDKAVLIKRAVLGQFGSMRDGTIGRAVDLVEGVGNTFNQLPDAINDGLDAVTTTINGALKDLGLKGVKFHNRGKIPTLFNISGKPSKGSSLSPGVSAPDFGDARGGFAGMASGGVVGSLGERGRDAVPTVLGRGEAVLNWAHQKIVNSALWNQYGTTLGGLFKTTRAWHAGGWDSPGFAAGGYSLSNVHEGVRNAAEAVLRRFPQLMVTSTFRPGDPGFHGRHQAVDIGGASDVMIRASEWIKKAMGRKLTEGIHNPNLSIKYGKTVPAGFWGGPTWAAHANHIHIAVAGMLGKIAGAISSQIDRIRLRGPNGAIKRIGQGALDRLVKGANEYLDSQGGMGDMDSHGVSGGLAPAQVRSVINQAMEMLGIPEGLRGAWRNMAVARARQESGFNPSAINNWDSNAKAGHPSQGLFQTIPSTFQSYMVRGHNNILGPLDNTLAAFRYMLAHYGRGNWGAALRAMLGRSGSGYATGGEIPGDYHGAPQLILGHAGEWILNKVQQSKLAGMLGTGVGKLRDALGFTGGPSSFAGGGEIPELPNVLPTTIGGLSGLTSTILRAVRRLDVRSKKLFENTLKGIDLLTSDSGLFALIGQRIETFATNAATTLQLAQSGLERIGGRIVARMRHGRREFVAGEQQFALQAETLDKSYDQLRSLLIREQRALDQINRRIRRIRRGGVTKGEEKTYEQLIGKRQELVNGIDDTTQKIAQNRADYWDTVRQKFEAGTADALRPSTQALNAAQLSLRIAQTLGDLGGVQSAGGAIIDALRAQKDEVIKRLAAAQDLAKKNPAFQDQVDQLTQQRDDLIGQITEQITQSITNQIQAIDASLSLQTGGLDLRGRVADVQGRFDPLGAIRARQGVAQDRAGVLQGARDQFAALLAATPADQIQAQQDLTQKIADLDVQMIENNANLQDLTATYRDTVTQLIRTRVDTQTGWLTGATGIITKIQEISGTLDPARLIRYAQTQAQVLATAAQDIVNNINTAVANGDFGGTAGNALSELVAAFQQGPAQFADALDRLSPLLSTLEAGMTDAQRTAFENLIQAMIDNTTSTLDNTQQLNDLNGTFNEPQTFSSTAWQWFRNAFFTGMGDVIPQYQVPAMQTGGYVTKQGLFWLHQGEHVINPKGGQHGMVREGDINLTLNEAEGPVDVVALASRIAFERKTAR